MQPLRHGIRGAGEAEEEQNANRDFFWKASWRIVTHRRHSAMTNVKTSS